MPVDKEAAAACAACARFIRRMRSHGFSLWKRTVHGHVRAGREVDRAIADAVQIGAISSIMPVRRPRSAPQALVAVAQRGVDEVEVALIIRFPSGAV